MSRFTLKFKLVTLCVGLLSVSVIVGAVAYFSQVNVQSKYDAIVNLNVPKASLANQMMLDYRRIRIGLRTLGMVGVSGESADEAIKFAETTMLQYEKRNEDYVALGLLPGQKELYEKAQTGWLVFKSLGQQVISLYRTGKDEDRQTILKIFMSEEPKMAMQYTAGIEALVAFHKERLDLNVKSAAVISQESQRLNFIVIVVGVVAGLLVGFWIANSISRQVTAVAGELKAGSRQVSDAADQVAKSSQMLAQSSTEQASSLEETVATMEEMTSMVKLSSANGQEAAALAAATRDIAVKGEEQINSLITSIHSISADSKKIAEITSVIDDIAFQTNLLALNAAVEAARAGEQGRGFAVVADAVRSLAQRSSVAAKDIAELIKNSVGKIEQSSEQASQGGTVLSEIVRSIKRVADLNSEVARAGEEQSNGIAQIDKAMNQLDQVTQQNAAGSEEAAASAEELSAQSEVLRKNVEVLEAIVFGTGVQPLPQNQLRTRVSQETEAFERKRAA